MSIPFDRWLIALQLCRCKFLDNEIFSRLFMVLVEISAKNDKFGYLNPIVGKVEVTHDLG